MSTTNLFLGVTGSVATRTVGTIIEHAHRNGFEQVIFHPTISALPFLVETILYHFPEIHHQTCIKKYTDELCHKIEK